MADTDALLPVGIVTGAYVLLAMNLMPLGPTAGMIGASDPQKRWGDRAFTNTMEHAPTFLSSLWIFAVFCSADVATKLGATYTILRAFYPIIWAVFGGANGPPMEPQTWLLFGKKMNLFYSTFPQYGIVFYMALAVVLKGLAIDLNALVVMPSVVAPLGFGLGIYHFALTFGPLMNKMVMPLFKPKGGMF